MCISRGCRGLSEFVRDLFRRKQPCLLEVVVFSGVLPEDPQQIQGWDERGFRCSGGAMEMFVAVFFCFLAKLDTTWQHGTTFFFKRGGRLDTRNDIFRFLCCMKCLLGNLLVSSMVHFYSQKMLRRNLRCCDSCSTRLGCPSDQVDSQWHKWRHRLVETSRLSADGDHPEYTWSPTSKTCIEPSSPGTIPFVPRRLIFSFVVKQVKMMVCKRNFYFFISFFCWGLVWKTWMRRQESRDCQPQMLWNQFLT